MLKNIYDGKGFDVGSIMERGSDTKGLGLRSNKKRSTILNGIFHAESGKKGTNINVQFSISSTL